MTQLLSKFRSVSGSRFFLLLVSYAVVLVLALVLAYALRFDFVIPSEVFPRMVSALVWVVAIQLFSLFLFRQLAGLLTYFSIPDLQRIFSALLVSSLLISIVYWIKGYPVAPPRGVIVGDFALSLMGIASLRLGFRMIGQGVFRLNHSEAAVSHRVGVVGAGDAGAKLAQELLSKRELGLRPVVFFDDDSSKWNSRIHGIPVIGPLEEIFHKKESLLLDRAIIEIGRASCRGRV